MMSVVMLSAVAPNKWWSIYYFPFSLLSLSSTSLIRSSELLKSKVFYNITISWIRRCYNIFGIINACYNKLGHFDSYSREFLLKGMAQYSSPPCTNQFRLTIFNTDIIFSLFITTSYLNEEVNCTEPSTSMRVPCLQISPL